MSEINAGVSNLDLLQRNKNSLDVTELEQTAPGASSGSLNVSYGYGVILRESLGLCAETKKWRSCSESRTAGRRSLAATTEAREEMQGAEEVRRVGRPSFGMF
jgi:hypothetical protein